VNIHQETTGQLSSTRYHMIDSDTHFTEPHDLWVSRASEKFKARVPQVKEVNGVRSWYIDGSISIGDGAFPNSAIKKDGNKARTTDEFFGLTIEDVHPASFDVDARLKYMDQNGVWAHIMYPNILGFGGQQSAKVDPELRLVSTMIFNDAMADIQAQSAGRLCGMALLPWWDVNDAVAETKRCLDLGLKGININSAPHNHQRPDGGKLPPLGDVYWDPLWDLCNQTRLPINFHIGSSDQSMDWMGSQWWPGMREGMAFGIGGAMLFFQNAQTLGNLIYSGLLDRFTELQFVSVESGIGWIPFMLEALDYQYDEIAGSTGLQRHPSEYFATNFHGTFWFEEKFIEQQIRMVGLDRCMFQTDFPHPTSLYPIGDLGSRLRGFSKDERQAVLFGNCARLYGIELPSNIE